ncbi:MAG: hypothetical protein AMXMBFR25_07070 [Lysobacterales bacterium]|nr:hypothetical protein [Xanthomonadales bacterium]
MNLNWLELRVPPLLVLLAAMALMVLMRTLTPSLTLDLDTAQRLGLSLPLLLLGIATALAGLIEFRRRRTTANPMHPERASTLVRSGVYRLTRNPMYLGMLFALLALAVALANAATLLILPAFIVYMNRFQILPEERHLAHRFGADFQNLRREVRRWL